jgi:hypothetical protein
MVLEDQTASGDSATATSYRHAISEGSSTRRTSEPNVMKISNHREALRTTRKVNVWVLSR